MKFKLRILFLGYNKKETNLIGLLEDRGCKVDHTSENFFDASNYDLIISFGYRHIIPNEAINDYCPIINLHISFLPFNRGSHPNFWSHFDDTPSGVTIHLIDKGIDTGKYLYQKKVFFNIKKITYKESYEILINEIENLFIQNLEEILSFKFDPKEYRDKGTYHSSADLPKEVDWSRIIYDQMQSLGNDK